MVKIRQTEDKKLLEEIIKQLKEHDGHCPCQFDDNSSDTICICASFKETINSQAPGEYECPCGRYIATISKD